ncbi:non-ltr retroelement reverse transcriptase [Gossypium australe]|uniref:Non-ltr retroelement reverse transcriptase n=1 Tax=Gossypium australe TaxID=47621 RepID=A0A5B6VCX1_9ROSI|nr:non-ltr retroelement reverse transcriptase [Gossypium australe]
MNKLKNLQIGLKKWANAIKRKKGELKKRLTKELEVFLMEDREHGALAKIIDTKIHLNMEIEKDEVYWEQRARANWLQCGDRNTTYFHDGKEIIDDPGLQEAAKTYFENMFTSKAVANPSKVLEGIEGSISHETSEGLQSPFKEEEVQMALKGMGSTKAPGPDGFPALFFQKY